MLRCIDNQEGGAQCYPVAPFKDTQAHGGTGGGEAHGKEMHTLCVLVKGDAVCWLQAGDIAHHDVAWKMW